MACVWESTTVIVSFNSKHKGSMLELWNEPPWKDSYHGNEQESQTRASVPTAGEWNICHHNKTDKTQLQYWAYVT